MHLFRVLPFSNTHTQTAKCYKVFDASFSDWSLKSKYKINEKKIQIQKNEMSSNVEVYSE